MAKFADLKKIWQWNSIKPVVVNQCLHELFTEQAVKQPNALALHAWDGQMEYHELDTLSSKLAAHMVGLGIQPDDMVLLSFEKSMWTQVAMLAVLKAGGAIVPVDINQSPTRHEEILRQTGAKIILTSTQYSTLWRNCIQKIITVSQTSLSELPGSPVTNIAAATPSNAAYVMFTSGSTGVPKAVVMEHSAISTACPAHAEALCLTNESRVLQFSPYTFDVCIMEIFATLLCGGCVCVASESDRRGDLAGIINNLNVNWLWLTPTIARTLIPSEVPTLRFLLLGGEKITFDDCNRWKHQGGCHIQLISTYGPTECCITSVSSLVSSSNKDDFEPGFIGKGLSCTTWVVDLDDPSQLAPIGSSGELFIEGPLLARGYLQNFERTSASFVHDPQWLLQGGGGYIGRRGRVYKTGDLVHYLSDGSLAYEGRIERGAKTSNQRLQCSNIESQIRECMPQLRDVAAEMFMHTKGHGQAKEIIVVFVQLEGYAHKTLLTEEVHGNDLVAKAFCPGEVTEKIAIQFPQCLVPTVFFALPQLPTSASGKLDKRRLRSFLTALTSEEWSKIQYVNGLDFQL